MFFPLPRILLIPLGLFRLLWSWMQGSRELTKRDTQVLRWLRTRDDPIRPEDQTVRNYAEITEAARNGSQLMINYIDSKKKTRQRVIIPERIFRRGEYLYVDAICPEIEEYRVFRLDRIQSFQHLEG